MVWYARFPRSYKISGTKDIYMSKINKYIYIIYFSISCFFLGTPRRRWEDNIKMDLQEVGKGSWGLDGVGSGQGQVAGTCGYGGEFSSSINAGNFLTSCKVYWLASQEGLCSTE
jgi:hypothetical protein